MQNQIILYNGPNSPFGRKTKITSLVQEIILEEKIINENEIAPSFFDILTSKDVYYPILGLL